MALSDDARNRAAGHIEDVGGELGQYSQVVFTVTVEGDQWETIKGSSDEAADFVAWLAANVKE